MVGTTLLHWLEFRWATNHFGNTNDKGNGNKKVVVETAAMMTMPALE